MNRKIILIAVAVAALTGAVVLFAYNSRAVEIPKEYVAAGVCLACQKEAEFRVATGEKPPYVCPSCSQQSAFPWFYCYSCKKKFVPDLVRGPGGGPLVMPSGPSCPCTNCRSSQVGQYDADFAEGTPEAAPLPKWEP